MNSEEAYNEMKVSNPDWVEEVRKMIFSYNMTPEQVGEAFGKLNFSPEEQEQVVLVGRYLEVQKGISLASGAIN